ncbi:hypothetical protein BSL78_00700 [Apostichopus japonicus]|uniref:Uncharacterized protein n=1 Tax=Stichopus japonicus TaxID=307972 RepID=A0A2G8LQ77_STIJA|nr:hypothetical protein BSL78_00700 [Apostichopus japonicus]
MASRRDSRIVKLTFTGEQAVPPVQVFSILKSKGVAVPGEIDAVQALQGCNTYDVRFTSDVTVTSQCSDVSMFRRLNVPTSQCSDVSMFRRLNVPTSQCSDVSMFRRLHVPTSPCSDVSMFRRLYVPTSLCSDVSMFRRLYVPTSLCSDVSMFRRLYVPTIFWDSNFGPKKFEYKELNFG